MMLSYGMLFLSESQNIDSTMLFSGRAHTSPDIIEEKVLCRVSCYPTGGLRAFDLSYFCRTEMTQKSGKQGAAARTKIVPDASSCKPKLV